MELGFVFVPRSLERNPGLKDRLVGGSASEYLWGVCGDPEKAPKAFIRAVVHATLSDADGYVEDLTEQGIDDYIVKFGGEQVRLGWFKSSFEHLCLTGCVHLQLDAVWSERSRYACCYGTGEYEFETRKFAEENRELEQARRELL
mmetsp:Transcript_24036/g.94683  ORF Transcript_24036/g.94683 Transcript_24036/m.94683 type:complete len:145 (-) Transcript_24036:1895-2329(-)